MRKFSEQSPTITLSGEQNIIEQGFGKEILKNLIGR